VPDSHVQSACAAVNTPDFPVAVVSSPRKEAAAPAGWSHKPLSHHLQRKRTCVLATAKARSLYCDSSQIALDNYSFDEDYLRRLTEGDSSVEAHFTAYFGSLLTLKLRNRLRSAQGIDDIRQETFLRVLQTLRQKGGLEHPERLGAFVNSVCNNVLLEAFRAQSRYGPLPEEHSEPADLSVDLEGSLVSEDRKRIVKKVLDRLSAMDREILKMLFWEETNKQEICRVMGVSRDYLRVLVYRARLRFKAALQKVEAVVP